MYKKLFFIGLLTIVLQSCKTFIVDSKNSTVTQRAVSLLHIGDEEDLLLESNYKNSAIVTTTQPIKVIVASNSFTKQSYKAFLKANALQNKAITVKYVDSLENKPVYVSVTLANKVAVLDAFKEKQNSSLREYLSLQDDARLITSISLVTNKARLTKINTAEEVFITPFGLKSYALELYSGGRLEERILFTETVVFAYNTSGICWKENKKHQLEIVDFVEGYGCPSKTFKNANRAKKKINYFKF